MNATKIQKASMNFAKTFLATAILTAASVGPAFAAPKVEILGADYGGTGCPAGSASVTVSPDGQEVSILFDKYIAEAPSSTGFRKTCNLTIPIKVPSGYQISLFTADYRGYVAPNTRGTLRAEYFFAGQRGPVFSRTLNGEQEYNVRHPLLAETWSRCGDSVNVRANTSMISRGRGIATVDSLDFARRGGIIYHVKYRGCR